MGHSRLIFSANLQRSLILIGLATIGSVQPEIFREARAGGRADRRGGPANDKHASPLAALCRAGTLRSRPFRQ